MSLTIGEVANPNPPPASLASVNMTFEGIVTAVIDPDPGHTFYLPEPAGWFDVAQYLRGEHAAGVPADLSVMVLVAAVPEPSSLVLGGMAALIGLGVALRCRRGDSFACKLLQDRSPLLKKSSRKPQAGGIDASM